MIQGQWTKSNMYGSWLHWVREVNMERGLATMGCGLTQYARREYDNSAVTVMCPRCKEVSSEAAE